jgi:hypothetical protein
MRYPSYIESDYPFPDFFHARICYPEDHVQDVEAALRRTLADVLPGSGIQAGDRVALGVGSRGITGLASMVRIVCDVLKEAGARPIIIPAMGSHGSAMAEGQEKVLRTLNISPETCGADILSTMAVVRAALVFGEVPVFFSKDALAAEHSICINRIKPHTKFKADVESGLLKMLCVGMGKHEGALSYHRWALKYGFAELVKEMGRAVIENTNFRFGIGIVENAWDQPLTVEAVPGNRIPDREPALLELARKHFPRIPLTQADALIIGQIGKDISGAGMDPNVTGRAFDLKETGFSEIFKAGRVGILNLSEKTRGNAIGLGNADFITEKVFNRMDYEATLMNALTSMSLHKAFIPIRLPNDQKVIQACFTTIGPIPPENVQAVIIRDTRHAAEFWATRAVTPLLETIKVEFLEKTILSFDKAGNLKTPDLWQ